MLVAYKQIYNDLVLFLFRLVLFFKREPSLAHDARGHLSFGELRWHLVYVFRDISPLVVLLEKKLESQVQTVAFLLEVEEHLLTLLVRQDNEQSAHVLHLILKCAFLILLEQVLILLCEQRLQDELFNGWIEERNVLQEYFVGALVSDDLNLELKLFDISDLLLYDL